MVWYNELLATVATPEEEYKMSYWCGLLCMVLYNRNAATLNTDSKDNLTSLYFGADAMLSNRSHVEESLFQKQAFIVQILSRLFL